MGNVKSEIHNVASFKIFDQPKEFVNGGSYRTSVNNNHNYQLVNDKPYYVVNIIGHQSIENIQALCFIHTISEYELVAPIEGQLIPMSLWQPLVKKSVEECNRLYKEKVKGTYLQGTDIPMPPDEGLGG